MFVISIKRLSGASRGAAQDKPVLITEIKFASGKGPMTNIVARNAGTQIAPDDNLGALKLQFGGRTAPLKRVDL